MTQATRDAMADALTLEWMVRAFYRGQRYWQTSLFKAQEFSCRAQDRIAVNSKGAHVEAVLAAHHARRAVPGLR